MADKFDIKFITVFDGAYPNEWSEKTELVCHLCRAREIEGMLPLCLVDSVFMTYQQLSKQERDNFSCMIDTLHTTFATNSFVTYKQSIGPLWNLPKLFVTFMATYVLLSLDFCIMSNSSSKPSLEWMTWALLSCLHEPDQDGPLVAEPTVAAAVWSVYDIKGWNKVLYMQQTKPHGERLSRLTGKTWRPRMQISWEGNTLLSVSRSMPYVTDWGTIQQHQSLPQTRFKLLTSHN